MTKNDVDDIELAIRCALQRAEEISKIPPFNLMKEDAEECIKYLRVALEVICLRRSNDKPE